MDPHTLERLEFDRVRHMVAEHAHCALGRTMALKLKPTTREALVRQWLAQITEMQAAAVTIGLPPFGGLRDVRDMIRRAVPPAKLEPEELAELAASLTAANAVFRWAQRLPEACSELRSLGERLGDFTVIAEQIHRVVDSHGEVRNDASPRLARIRDAIEEARSRIQTVVDRLLRSSHIGKYLRYPEATFHNDRLVLPLALEHRGRVPGIVHRTSDSGATLFVEPAEAVELNNAIIQLRQDESEEIGRILWKLTHSIHRNATTLLQTFDALAVLDLIATKVRFAEAYEMTCPTVGNGQMLRLRQACHPLLLWLRQQDRAAGIPPREVVPIDVRLGDDFDLLVITGPNTGGKTVALKTVGLVAMMAQAGLPIPAEKGSTLPVYDDILIDVGDEQSLQQSLSTFSAHLTQLLRMLHRARPKTLALIDELGAGTDPDEGAAIGRAIVEELLRVGCHSMVSTHLGVLKSIAFTHPRADNAAVQFDTVSLRPTYRLLIGEPGNSNALAIAERLGMPKRVIHAAQRHLSRRSRALQKAIAGTLTTRREAEKARTEAEAAKVESDRVRDALERQRAELARQQAEFQNWTQAIARLAPGDPVYIRRFDRQGTIVRVQLQKQSAIVCVGAVDMEVALTELQLPSAT
ncbi:MAG: DNA strand exchange inhibitor protein [Phycisphaerae bacterium]|nr:DNA strand exchange inhibitor protein [Phycisphaerae bacterium]